jgi:predicted 3-demethylubiquinone-9 3-methyltransferase (glyoxalase superfamily)
MNMSYSKLFLTIYLSITLAGFTLFGVKHYLDKQATEQMIDQMEAAAAKAKFELERATFMAKLDAKRAQRSATHKPAKSTTVNTKPTTIEVKRTYQSSYTQERRRKEEARRTNHEVCNFWRKEYNKEKSKYNKSMMDGACYRAGTYYSY